MGAYEKRGVIRGRVMEAKCPGCGNRIQIAEEHRGTTVECPWCRKHLRVPAAPAPKPAQAPAPARAPARAPTRAPTRGPVRAPVRRSGAALQRARQSQREDHDAFALERSAFNAGVVGGIALIVVAGVWFYLGYKAGYIFFYPPILAVIGLAAIVNGLAGGGRRRRSRRR